jgi:hypothetical protein
MAIDLPEPSIQGAWFDRIQDFVSARHAVSAPPQTGLARCSVPFSVACLAGAPETMAIAYRIPRTHPTRHRQSRIEYCARSDAQALPRDLDASLPTSPETSASSQSGSSPLRLNTRHPMVLPPRLCHGAILRIAGVTIFPFLFLLCYTHRSEGAVMPQYNQMTAYSPWRSRGQPLHPGLIATIKHPHLNRRKGDKPCNR